MAAAMPGRCTTPKLLDKNCHPDPPEAEKDLYQVAPMLAEHPISEWHHCWQNILPA